MRIKPQQIRALGAIAVQRLSERELRQLYEVVNELGASAFVELVRDIEDEIESALSIGFERNLESDFRGPETSSLYYELENIRKKDLKITVSRFADLLEESLRNDPEVRARSIPRFDSRRGFQAWIKKLVNSLSEQQVYHAVMDVRSEYSGNDSASAWKLR